MIEKLQANLLHVWKGEFFLQSSILESLILRIGIVEWKVLNKSYVFEEFLEGLKFFANAIASWEYGMTQFCSHHDS